jgi:outer membrane lipoprotein-sorting protein
MVSIRPRMAERGAASRLKALAEIRNPKAETRKKPEARIPSRLRRPAPTATERCPIRASEFGLLSDLGLRVSDLGGGGRAAITSSARLGIPLLLLLLASVCPAADPSGLLDHWLAAQTNFHTWTADATQVRHFTTLAQPLTSTGKVWMAVPDHFRWEVGQPAQTIALRQPDQLILIYPRLKRMEKYPLNDKQPGMWKEALALLEASFPRSRAELELRFHVVSVTETNSLAQIELQPKSAAARKFMATMRISLRTNDFSLAATELSFSDGSSMRNEFSNVRTNATLPEGIFDAKLETGYTVVEPLRQ